MDALLKLLGVTQLKEWMPVLGSAAHVLLVLLIAWVLLLSARHLVEMFKASVKRRTTDLEGLKRIDTLSRGVHYVASVVVTLIAGMLILTELGISIEPILATAGIAGIAIGFGAQSILKDFLTGFFMLIEDQVRQGDIVEVAGKAGMVEEVTLRYVRLRDFEGHVHYVPNGNITTVSNRTRGFAYSVIDLRIPYHADLDVVFALMREAGAALRAGSRVAANVLEDIEIVGVELWAEASLIARCRFKVEPLAQWNVRREYQYQVKKTFDEAGLRIAFPYLTLLGTEPAQAAAFSGG